MSLRHSNSSESPSSEVPSNSTSPAQLSFRPFDDPDSLGTPSRSPVDLPRPASTGKGGCWTCRLRRKKCDEQRQGDSCHTCNRLKIKCLGWGPKRPDWMRDKQAVEAYKADIKAQLTRAGLIRGQPRSSILQATTASSSVFTTQHYQGPSSSTSQIANDPPSLIFGDPSPAGETSAMLSTFGSSTPYDFPLLQFDPGFPHLNTHSPFTPTTSIPSSHPSPHFTPTFDAPASSPAMFSTEITVAALSGQNIQTDHVLYYFEHVCRLQFALAGTSAENITYSLVLQNPHGSLTNALCALASLHHVCVCTGRLEPSAVENSQALRFYDNACAQLDRSRRVGLSEVDANAALHLLTFSIFSGGMTDWQSMLDIASEWLAHTGITTHDNPKLAAMNLSDDARLALKTTMWLDVMSTVTLRAVPKHLALYRRLYHDGGAFWRSSGRNTVDQLDTRVESLTGCPDEVLLAIAEISTLECWKGQEMRNQTLSTQELIRRGDVLERHLRIDCEPACSREAEIRPDSAMGDNPSGTTSPADVTRGLMAKIFRETAVLYLHTVLSGPYPGVPEIGRTVDAIIHLLRQLPVSAAMDRALVFPFYLTGCLTDDPVRREVLKSRLLGVRDDFRNIFQTARVLEAVWQRRDSRGGPVEWRDLLHVQGRHRLLLV